MVLIAGSNNISANPIKVGIYQNHPKVFIDEKGTPRGVLVDVMNEIAKREGWSVEYVYGTWSENIKRLEDFEIDILLDVSFSEERAQRFKLNQIFVIDDWIEVFVPVNTTLESVANLEGKRVAVLEGSIQEEFMRKEVRNKFDIDMEVIPFADYVSTVESLNSNHVDAIVASRFFFFSKDRGANIWPSSLILRPSYTFFAFPKNQSDEVVMAIDNHLMDLKNDSESEYYKSIKKWLRPVSQQNYQRIILLIIGIVLIIAIAGIAFIATLRHEINVRTTYLKQRNQEIETINSKLEKLVYDYRNTEQELLKFRFMVENARQEVYLVHPNGDIVYANNSAYNNLGYSHQEIAEGGIKLFDPTYGANYQEHFNRLKQQEEPTFETVHYTKGGRQLDKRIKSFYLKIDNQEYICSFAEDITQQKKAKKALYESQQLFQTLARMSPVGIFRTRADGYTTYVNPRWCELSGLSFAEALGDTWISAVHPDDRDILISNWKVRSSKGLKSEAEYRFLRPDGKIVWVLGNAVPEKDGDTITGYIGTITDITELKLAEILLKQKAEEIEKQNKEYRRLNEELQLAKAKAEESDKLKSSFLANMSHEIRTPMNAICGFSRLLERNNLDEKKRVEFIDIINANSQQLLGIINDIVDISKIESGQVKVVETEFDLNTLIDNIVNSVAPTINKRKVQLNITKRLPNTQSKIISDEVKLGQILTNLLVNAIKFTKEGNIEISYKLKDNETLEFKVSDTGIGIANENLSQIFERFLQVEGTSVDSRKGTGLGLPISKGFAELLGGSIWVESELGIGSTFGVTIPYVPQKPTEVTTSGEGKASKSWAGKTILVVEDDEHTQYFIKEVLASSGVTTIFVDDGEKAVQACKEMNQIDLVLMDIKLPKMNGLEATRQIRRFNKNLPIIAQTAHAFTSDSENAKEAGCNGFITKPININELNEQISKYLG
jgi:PAS domain S-box-containing protein